MLNGNSEPKIVILAERQIFIKPTHRLEKVLSDHHCGWAHEAKLQAPREDISGRFAVFDFRIHSDSVSQPHFFGLTNRDFRMLLHIGQLDLQFSWLPEIV